MKCLHKLRSWSVDVQKLHKFQVTVTKPDYDLNLCKHFNSISKLLLKDIIIKELSCDMYQWENRDLDSRWNISYINWQLCLLTVWCPCQRSLGRLYQWHTTELVTAAAQTCLRCYILLQLNWTDDHWITIAISNKHVYAQMNYMYFKI